MQIIAPVVGDAWFDTRELRGKVIETGGPPTGAACSKCSVWRWMPMDFGELPTLRVQPKLGDVDIAASPEWFGAGWKAFRQILLRRELGELIANASPRDFTLRDVA
jgi:hypothetical protein